ncbi:MAG: hypothetical protein KJ558_10385 [Gammaproteobacteria bacterium]|nr:hypothetical protein [Gammaproteobacteria bacterium]MBU1655215.1 hypothetical protein [Gammaproteobacteria bacterium]MBU1960485.1 hypothetical protein [Gammaproteobacteria bacterium]
MAIPVQAGNASAGDEVIFFRKGSVPSPDGIARPVNTLLRSRQLRRISGRPAHSWVAVLALMPVESLL